MITEIYMTLIMAVGGLGFAIGGSGYKWVRRYLMPVVIAVLCYLAGVGYERCLGYGLTYIGVLHLGYGESLPYWRKTLTAIAYVTPTFFLGFTFWQVLAPVIFIVMFWLSNQKATAEMFQWKIVEFLTGTYYAVVAAYLIGGYA